MFLGLLASFFVPYVRKLKEGEIDFLEWKYVVHLIGATIWQFLLGLPVYTAWNPPDAVGVIAILVLAFAFGYGGNSLQKEIEKDIRFFLS
jgi:hypothetical protein